MAGRSQPAAKTASGRIKQLTVSLTAMTSAENQAEVCEACQSLRPMTPPADACCGSGCAECVFDVFDQEIELWKKTCRRKHGSAQADVETDPTQTAMDKMDYREYVLESITPVCVNTAIYRFALSPGKRLDLSIAKHIILRAVQNGRVITRQYTPISSPETIGYFEVLIKLYASGEMSQYIKQWKVGDQVEWRGPIGSFTYQPNEVHRVLAIAAGTGITPIVQVIQHILQDKDDETTVRLLYACRKYDEILLRDLLNELALYWNVTIKYFLSEDSLGSHPVEYGETIIHGRITKETVSKELEAVSGRTLRAVVCGSRTFEDDMMTFLKDGGVPENCINRF